MYSRQSGRKVIAVIDTFIKMQSTHANSRMCLVYTLALISLLAFSGADINARDYDEMTPLMLAIKAGYVETISVFLDMGCDLHSEAKNDKSVLVWAIDKEYTALLKVRVHNK